MSELKFEIKDNPDSQENKEDLILKQGLRDFNHNLLGESGSYFRIIASDNNEVVGGLIPLQNFIINLDLKKCHLMILMVIKAVLMILKWGSCYEY